MWCLNDVNLNEGKYLDGYKSNYYGIIEHSIEYPARADLRREKLWLNACKLAGRFWSRQKVHLSNIRGLSGV